MRGLLPPSLGLGTLPKDTQGMEGVMAVSRAKPAPAKARKMPMPGKSKSKLDSMPPNPGASIKSLGRKLGNKGY